MVKGRCDADFVVLKLPKSGSEIYRRQFNSRSTRQVEAAFFKACRHLLDDVDQVEASYRVLRSRGADSEALWQGMHALLIARHQLRTFGIAPFAKIMRKIEECSKR